MCEKVAPYLESICSVRSRLKIISNLADRRLARSSAKWLEKDIGSDVVDGIIDAWQMASNDPYRRATNNKGIMNGIDAVAIATGNDFRALEAGAHTYSSVMSRPLASFEKDENGDLVGRIELPVASGIIGGSISVNPVAKTCLKIMDVSSSQELAQVLASVGLANNFAALRAIVKEGINRGHMKLHAYNIAFVAGVSEDKRDEVAKEMIRQEKISVAAARNIAGSL